MKYRIFICSITSEYIDYLRKFDSRVRENNEGKRKYIGVLFNIGDKKYYAPLSSPKPKHLKIKDKAPDIVKIDGGKLGVINLNNMIPVPDSEVNIIDIERIPDEKYKNLLRKQADFIGSHEKLIIKKAERLYKIVNSGKQPRLNMRCCDYKLLEIKCLEYISLKQNAFPEIAAAKEEKNP